MKTKKVAVPPVAPDEEAISQLVAQIAGVAKVVGSRGWFSPPRSVGAWPSFERVGRTFFLL